MAAGAKAEEAMYALRDKAIVIVGAAQPYGRDCVARFAAAGAKVLASDRRNPGDVLRKTKTPFVRADGSDEAEMRALMEHAAELYGHFDGIVCLPGSEAVTWQGPVTESSLDWDIGQNAKALLWCLKHGTPLMNDGGAVVAVAAQTALTGGATIASFAAAQAAVVAIAKSAALELAARRIRVNCVLTGPFDSPHLEDTERELAVAARLNPLGRMPKGDELAALAQFLLADESAFITAASIPFDGGASAGAVAPNIVDALAEVLGTGREPTA
jgi:NAD(P)-dependent dehydrogenase (short-subunit alcohol dehydrogenase family)